MGSLYSCSNWYRVIYGKNMLQKKRRYLFRWLTPKANVIQNEWEWKWCAHTHNLCTKRDMANEKENREDANGIIGLMHRSIDLMKNKQYQFEATRLINFDHYWLNDRKSEFICKWMFANIFSSAYEMLQLGYCTFFSTDLHILDSPIDLACFLCKFPIK